MRWRFVDRVTLLEPWQRVAGRKAVSLEEYLLLEPLGREGVFPETLVIECCVELARWLVTVSSSFAQSAVLCEVGAFSFAQVADEGTVLDLRAQVLGRSEGDGHRRLRRDWVGRPPRPWGVGPGPAAPRGRDPRGDARPLA